MVYYNVQALKQSMSSQVNKCCEQIEYLNSECVVLRQRFEESREQLRTAQIALCDVTNENEIFRKKCEVAKQTVWKLKDKNEDLQAECTKLQLENLDVSSEDDTCESDPDYEGDAETMLKEMVGDRRYSPEIRKLYYSLLADQVPVSKIADIIRAVLKCFNPAMNLEDLRLPKKAVQVTCAKKS